MVEFRPSSDQSAQRHVVPPLSELQQPRLATEGEPLAEQTRLESFFTQTHALAADYVLANPQIWPGGAREFSEELATQVLVQKDFSDVIAATPEHTQALELARVRERINRRLIKQTVEGANQLALSETEKAVILASCDIGESFDDLFMQWRKKIAAEPAVTKELLEQQEHAYVYVIGREAGEGTELVPYVTAFPEPIKQIDTRIKQMLTDLRGISGDDAQRAGLIAYYEKFAQALTSDEISAHETLFSDVDRLWRQLPQDMRMLPIHMMEVADDPHDKRVTPDYALLFAADSDRSRSLNEQIHELQQPFTAAVNEISHSDYLQPNAAGGVMVGFGAGMRLHFSPTGQFGPNRPIRLELGVGMAIDKDQIEKNRANQARLLQKVFGDGVPLDNAEALTDMRVLATAGHEIAHNAFMDEGTIDRLGDEFNHLEEVKADIATLAALPDLVGSSEQQDAMLVGILGVALFYFAFADRGKRFEYYNAGITTLRTMVDAGFLVYEDDRFRLDFTKKADCFIRAKQVSRDVATVYATTDQPKDAAQTFINEYKNASTTEPALIALKQKLVV